jgi:hypothetical protein
LATALGIKRDRVFNGLTVKRVSFNKHKGAFLYALVPVDEGLDPRMGEQPNLDLIDSIDSADLADLADLMRTSSETGPPALSYIETITSEPSADLADLKGLFRGETKNTQITVGERACRENSMEQRAEIASEVRKVRAVSATDTYDDTCTRRTSVSEVRTRSARSAEPGSEVVIDLANLPEDWNAPGRDPP